LNIKRVTNPLLGFKSFKSLCGADTRTYALHMNHKGQSGTSNVIEEVTLINQLFGVA